MLLLLAALVASVVALVWLARTEARLRTARMAAACLAMGLDFQAEGAVGELQRLSDLPLLRRGRLRKVRNVMTGRFRGRRVVFFDYAYTEDVGDDSWTYRQSIALFPGTGLPDLVLEPKSFLRRIAGALGMHAIAFDAGPAFSDAYRLTGPDEGAVRRAFSTSALDFFGRERHWRVEVKHGTAGVWCHDRRCKPEEAELCLAELVYVMDVLAPV